MGSALQASSASSAASLCAGVWSRGSHVTGSPPQGCLRAPGQRLEEGRRSPATVAASGQWVAIPSGRVGHVDDWAGAPAAERPIAQPEVQGRADHHDQVRLGLGQPPARA